MNAIDPDTVGRFEEHEFPFFRNATIDTLRWGSKRHHIPLLLEVDVTQARDAIRALKTKTGEGVSFTGWIIKCLGQAVSEHKHIHALRKGKRRLVVFEDVDVAIVVERAVSGGAADETLPMPYIIRKANQKTVADIHAEIRLAQTTPVAQGEVQIASPRAAWLTKVFMTLPGFIRDALFWGPLFGDPFRVKRMMGTVSVTAVGMMGHGGISWGIPLGIHSLIVGVGGITPRPILVNGQVVPREYLGLTVMFDHDVTDGAPIARFIGRLQELMESGYGLVEAREGQP